MKKIRILTLASVFALSGLMTGCFEDGSNESPTITDFRIAVSVGTEGQQSTTIDVTASTQAVVYGKYADDNAIKTVSISFKDPTGAAVSPTVSKTGAAPGGKAWNSNVDGKWVITPLTGLCNGEYTATATVTDDEGASSSATAKFTITGAATTCGTQPTTLKDTTVDMRASSSSLAGPPYLDVDAMVTYGSAAASANSAVVDLRFNNTSASSEAGEIRAPSAAEAGTSMAGWTTKNATKFHKVTGKYATTNTQAGIDALYNAGSAVDHIVVANGDEIVVKSVSGKVVLIKINSITGPGTADVQFSVKGYK